MYLPCISLFLRLGTSRFALRVHAHLLARPHLSHSLFSAPTHAQLNLQSSAATHLPSSYLHAQLDLNGVEPGVLRSLHDACEAQPSLWPRRITYEQGNMPHSENKHALIHLFTQHGYAPAMKPIEVRKPGHSLHYSHLTWDMVLERIKGHPAWAPGGA